MSVASAIARPQSQRCHGGCGSRWAGNKAWLSCWFCAPGKVLAYCRDCGLEHMKTPEHREAAARAKASMLEENRGS